LEDFNHIGCCWVRGLPMRFKICTSKFQIVLFKVLSLLWISAVKPCSTKLCFLILYLKIFLTSETWWILVFNFFFLTSNFSLSIDVMYFYNLLVFQKKMCVPFLNKLAGNVFFLLLYFILTRLVLSPKIPHFRLYYQSN